MKRFLTRTVSFITAFAVAFALTGLFGQGGIKASAATSYDLFVADIRVTSSNCGDILGNGAVSYNDSTKTLTFKKSLIMRPNEIIRSSIKGLTIASQGNITLENSYRAVMRLDADTNIKTSGGRLTLKSGKNYAVIFCQSDKTVKPVISITNATMTIDGATGFNGQGSDPVLSVTNSDVTIKATASAITDFDGGLNFTNCHIETPDSIRMMYGCVYQPDGSTARDMHIVPGLEVKRFFGNNRYETAVSISKQSYTSAQTVVLASGESYADALAGVPLAYMNKAPILLTPSKTLAAVTFNEIKRLGAKKVIILGGTGAVSANIEQTLKNSKLTVERLCGDTRYGTAIKIAKSMSAAPTYMIFAYGNDYADALSASSAAALMNMPIIYLKKGDEPDAETAEYLKELYRRGCVYDAWIIGGTGVISEMMEQYVKNALNGTRIRRVAGDNRYKTSIAVNREFSELYNGGCIGVATGTDFPDALAGGVLSANRAAAICLANGSLSDEQTSYLKAKSADRIYVFGGPAAVPSSLVSRIKQASA